MAREFCYPTVRESLGDYYEMTWRCAKCGFCRNVFPSDTEHERFGRQCPSGERFRFESYYASGRNELARLTIEGKQGFTDRFRHVLYSCTTCNACEEWCEATQGLYPVKLTMAMRKHFAEQGGELLPEHQKLVKSLRENKNRLNRNNRDRLAWLGEAAKSLPEKADLAFFVGCRSSFRRTEIARSAYELLTKRLGLKVAILTDERCCGRPLLDIGAEQEARELISHNLAQLQKTGASQVVFACAECFHTFRSLAPLGFEVEFESLHLSELLAAKLQQGALGFKALKKRVAFQDPCHLGRHQGVFEPPRKLLASMAQLELVEMPRNRKNAWCCGAGGGVQDAMESYSQWVASERLQEVKHVAAELLVTACPGCKENLWAKAQESGVQVLDLAELLCQQAEG